MNCKTTIVTIGPDRILIWRSQEMNHPPVYDETATSISTPIPAQLEVFTAYVNLALSRAMSERFARWGNDFIDPKSSREPVDNRGNPLGVQVYEAYSCQFGTLKPKGASEAYLELTVDLRAKVVRTASVLDQLYEGKDIRTHKFSPREQADLKRKFKGEVVIYMSDKRCYSVVDLIFEHSPDSMAVEGLNMSHTQYFKDRKDTILKYPKSVPMVAVLGRRNQTIYLPAELIAFNDLHPSVKQKLPSIASYMPDDRNKCIEKIRQFLIPGAQKTKGAGGLLPALGVMLNEDRLSAKAEVLPMPSLIAAGVPLPRNIENWAPALKDARFNVNPNHSVILNVVLICNPGIKHSGVYTTIRDLVNKSSSKYRLSTAPPIVLESGEYKQQLAVESKSCTLIQTNLLDTIVVLQEEAMSSIGVPWRGISEVTQCQPMCSCWISLFQDKRWMRPTQL